MSVRDRVRPALLAALLLVLALGLTLVTVGAGPRTSRYWIAGWLPKGDHLLDATNARGSRVARYGGSTSADGVVVTVNPYGDEPLPACDRLARGATGTVVRGRAGCTYVDTDEGQAIGTVVEWHEAPHVNVLVELFSNDAATVRRIADDVQPVDAGTWNRLVESTRIISTPEPGMPSTVVASGQVDGSPWTLTAFVPKGFPLGPEDHRSSCAQLQCAGATSAVCGVNQSRFVRLGGSVFAYGIVHVDVSRVDLREVLWDNGPLGAGAVVESPAAAADPPARARFFASPLPADNCGVFVLDPSHPTKPLAFDFGVPSDRSCTIRVLGHPPPGES